MQTKPCDGTSVFRADFKLLKNQLQELGDSERTFVCEYWSVSSIVVYPVYFTVIVSFANFVFFAKSCYYQYIL